MDIIYPYKATVEDYELRYSLRSLENLPHDRVIIAGDRPACINENVQFIANGWVRDRYMSSTANILAALNNLDVSDDFIVMADDIFVLEPWHFRHQYRCPIEEYLHNGGCAGEYRKRVVETRDILRGAYGIRDPLFFGLHTPTVYNRTKLLELTREFTGRTYLLRTLYHNLFPEPAERRNDVKVRRWTNAQKGDVVSTSDACARLPEFRAWIERRFPDPSAYEVNG